MNGPEHYGMADQLLQLRWANHVGSHYTGPAAHPELVSAEASLARQRDETRRAILARWGVVDGPVGR